MEHNHLLGSKRLRGWIGKLSCASINSNIYTLSQTSQRDADPQQRSACRKWGWTVQRKVSSQGSSPARQQKRSQIPVTSVFWAQILSGTGNSDIMMSNNLHLGVHRDSVTFWTKFLNFWTRILKILGRDSETSPVNNICVVYWGWWPLCVFGNCHWATSRPFWPHFRVLHNTLLSIPATLLNTWKLLMQKN